MLIYKMIIFRENCTDCKCHCHLFTMCVNTVTEFGLYGVRLCYVYTCCAFS